MYAPPSENRRESKRKRKGQKFDFSDSIAKTSN